MAKNLRGYYQTLLLSYVWVVALPILLLSVLIYNIGVVKLRAEMISTQRLLLGQAAGTLHQRIEEINGIAKTISFDNQVISLSPKLNMQQSIQGIALLRRYKSSNLFVDEIFIRNRQDALIYTDMGTVDEAVLFRVKHHFSQEEYERYRTLALDDLHHIAYFDKAGMIVVLQPIPVIGNIKIGTVGFFINRNAIAALFSGNSPTELGRIVLLDEESRIIFQADPNSALKDEGLIDAVLAQSQQDRFTYKGKAYTLVQLPAAEMGWTFLSILPEQVIQARMRTAYLVVWLVGIVLLGAVLVFDSARRQYQPIQKLSQLARQDETEPTTNDELSQISDALSRKRQLRLQVEEQRRRWREDTLRILLRGEDLDADALERLISVERATSGFFVVLMQSKAMDVVFERAERFGIAAARMDGQIAVVLSASGGGCSETGPLNERFDDCCMGIGGVHRIEEITVSYLEASIAMDQCLKRADAQTVRFEDVRNMPTLHETFQRKEMLFIKSLRVGNAAIAQESLDGLLLELNSRGLTKPLLMVHRFHLVEQIAQQMMEAPMSKAYTPQVAEKLSALLMHALSYGNALGYESGVREMMNIAIESVQTQKEKVEAESNRQVLEWLDDRLCDPELSLELLSDTFGYSTTYWSRLFSDKLGTTFSDYIWRKRLALFKNRLVKGNETIKELVLAVGYLDVSSFTRRFRETEGITPGQYRKEHTRG